MKSHLGTTEDKSLTLKSFIIYYKKLYNLVEIRSNGRYRIQLEYGTYFILEIVSCVVQADL